MRGDLKNAVAGRVDDWKSGTNVFFAQLFENFRARSGLVSDRFAANCFFKFGCMISGGKPFL